MYRVTFYVPESHLEQVKQAMFTAGAGRFSNYDQVCWQALGMGQFRPQKGSQPHIGQQDILEQVPEYKVEMICDDQFLQQAIKALLSVHPYEEPAYEFYPINRL